jgi:hypothetical protein
MDANPREYCALKSLGRNIVEPDAAIPSDEQSHQGGTQQPLPGPFRLHQPARKPENAGLPHSPRSDDSGSCRDIPSFDQPLHRYARRCGYFPGGSDAAVSPGGEPSLHGHIGSAGFRITRFRHIQIKKSADHSIGFDHNLSLPSFIGNDLCFPLALPLHDHMDHRFPINGESFHPLESRASLQQRSKNVHGHHPART